MPPETTTSWSRAKLEIVKSVTGYTEKDEEFIEYLIDIDMAKTPSPPNIWQKEERTQPTYPPTTTATTTATIPQTKTQRKQGNKQNKQETQITKKTKEGPLRKRQPGEWYYVYPTPKKAPKTPTL